MPFYLVGVWFLTKSVGIEGTAIAWTIRVVVDCALLFWAVERLLGGMPRRRTILAGIGAIAAGFALSMASLSLPMKLAVLALELTLYLLATWFLLFGKKKRAFLLKRIVGGASLAQDGLK